MLSKVISGYERISIGEFKSMSVSKKYYVIAGYDLTRFRTNNYEDWKWTKEGEELTYNQRKGCIQLFDDPMSGLHLYLGYILASADEYEFETVKINWAEASRQEPLVCQKLKQLIDANVMPDVFNSKDLRYELIVFEECC